MIELALDEIDDPAVHGIAETDHPPEESLNAPDKMLVPFVPRFPKPADLHMERRLSLIYT